MRINGSLLTGPIEGSTRQALAGAAPHLELIPGLPGVARPGGRAPVPRHARRPILMVQPPGLRVRQHICGAQTAPHIAGGTLNAEAATCRDRLPLSALVEMHASRLILFWDEIRLDCR